MTECLSGRDADRLPQRELFSNELLGNCIDALDRLQGFVGCLHDTLERVTANHGVDYGSRLHVADYIALQLERIANALDGFGRRYYDGYRSNQEDLILARHKRHFPIL